MKAKNEIFKTIAVIVLLAALLPALCSCSANKKSRKQDSGLWQAESRTELRADSGSGHMRYASELRGEETRRDSSRGRLEIHRDPAGRPVLLLWQNIGFMQGTLARGIESGGNYGRGSSSAATSASTAVVEAKSKEKEQKTAAGTSRIFHAAAISALIILAIWLMIQKKR